MGFPRDVTVKALVACGRHCCICHKFCGFKIELHHIIQTADNGDDSFENCIPLCFDCHADVKAYNPKHPKGRKFTEPELRAHRDSWYQKVKENYRTPLSSENLAFKEKLKDGSKFVWFESMNNVREEEFKETEINGPKHVEGNTRNSKEERSKESVDYIFTDIVKFREEEISLIEKIALLNEGKKTANDLGLRDSVKATEAQIILAESQLYMLRKRIMIIEKGYEFWDKIGFQIACEACVLYDYWCCIGTIDNDKFVPTQDIDLGIPPVALRKLKLAIDSGLFKSFMICQTFEPPDDDGNPNDLYEQAPTTIDYYMFGSPCYDESDENAELFLIDHWNSLDLH